MDRFTKEQMLNELRTIFLFEADHVLLASGEEKAEAFIGFSVGDEGEYCFQSPTKVDLSLFREIEGAFDRGYDYAFRPSVMNSLGEHEVQNLSVFMQGTPRAGGILSGGETHRFMSSDGYCQTVADAVHARWKLEWDSVGAGSHTFSTRELALLANMTEGAVRNAIADKSESGLRAIPGTKNPIKVEHDEAWRWLSGRRGFIPQPVQPSEDRFLTEHLRGIESAKAFGKLILDRSRATYDEPAKAPEAIGWTREEFTSWCLGEFKFNEERAEHLGWSLNLDVPLFVGKALEVSLRRDAASAEGDRA